MNRRARQVIWIILAQVVFLILLAVSAARSQNPVPRLRIHEGTVSGMGSNADGEQYIVVAGMKRRLQDDSHYSSIEHGDWVQVACTIHCWVWIVRKRDEVNDNDESNSE